MKNKVAILCSILVIAFCTLVMGQQHNSNTPFLDGDEIVLQGVLETGANPDDIGASVNEDVVQVYFSRSFGNVSLSLYNGNNMLIYSGVVNTGVQQLVVIPINGMASGTYTLVLSNNNGVAEGEFER
jgi:hypothetical protein